MDEETVEAVYEVTVTVSEDTPIPTESDIVRALNAIGFDRVAVSRF